MSDFHQYLARQCAIGREKFGPGERRGGVPDHIRKELVEIEKEETSKGRATEWVDVAILGMDGLLRATRQSIRDDPTWQGDHYDEETERPIILDGEPTNDFVAAVALELIVQKFAKNELRDFGNWREASEDVAMEHKRGIHD